MHEPAKAVACGDACTVGVATVGRVFSTLMLVGVLSTTALGSASAKEVTLEFEDLTLNANLEIADGKQFSDGVVLIMHSFLAHNRMEIIAASQTALLENGQSSLAINGCAGTGHRRHRRRPPTQYSRACRALCR